MQVVGGSGKDDVEELGVLQRYGMLFRREG